MADGGLCGLVASVAGGLGVLIVLAYNVTHWQGLESVGRVAASVNNHRLERLQYSRGKSKNRPYHTQSC